MILSKRERKREGRQMAVVSEYTSWIRFQGGLGSKNEKRETTS